RAPARDGAARRSHRRDRQRPRGGDGQPRGSAGRQSAVLTPGRPAVRSLAPCLSLERRRRKFTELLHSRPPWACRFLFCRCSVVGISDGEHPSIRITKIHTNAKKMAAEVAVTLAGRDSRKRASPASANQVRTEQTRLLHANAPLSQLVALINASIL